MGFGSERVVSEYCNVPTEDCDVSDMEKLNQLLPRRVPSGFLDWYHGARRPSPLRGVGAVLPGRYENLAGGPALVPRQVSP